MAEGVLHGGDPGRVEVLQERHGQVDERAGSGGGPHGQADARRVVVGARRLLDQLFEEVLGRGDDADLVVA